MGEINLEIVYPVSLIVFSGKFWCFQHLVFEWSTRSSKCDGHQKMGASPIRYTFNKVHFQSNKIHFQSNKVHFQWVQSAYNILNWCHVPWHIHNSFAGGFLDQWIWWSMLAYLAIQPSGFYPRRASGFLSRYNLSREPCTEVKLQAQHLRKLWELQVRTGRSPGRCCNKILGPVEASLTTCAKNSRTSKAVEIQQVGLPSGDLT